ncbi:ATP-binding protein [Candidatus Amesbacteria bacterium]|nr:ATP-binding protein [Candidatus Amesbacteria bacterium]
MKIRNSTEILSFIPKNYLRRQIHPKILQSIKKDPEVTIIYGSRQVGKTVEVFKCLSLILEENKQNDIFFYNLDNQKGEDFDSPDKFLASILAQKEHDKTYVFIDEAQRLDDIGLFIKYLYDLHKDIKFILTGSASLDIKQKIKEPLTGRKQEFFLSPLDLREILFSHSINLSKIGNTFSLLEQILEDYMLFGGYPGVLTLTGSEKKIQKLNEIANSYILRDTLDEFGIKDEAKMRLAAAYLAENIGSLFSLESLVSMGGLTRHLAEKLIMALEKSFVVFPIRPFSQNKAKELVHRPKYYFWDPGIRNAVLEKLRPNQIVLDKGKLFENALAIGLNLRGTKLNYWRTLNQTEVDFISGDRAFESKYGQDSTSTTRNLQSLLAQYPQIKSGKVIGKKNYWEIYQ